MKHYLIALSILLILISSGLAKHYHAKLKEAERGRDAAISDYKNVTVKYVNAQGDIVSQTKAFELSKNEYKKALENKDLQWGKKFKDFKNTQAAQSFTTTIEVEKIKRDTIRIACKDSIKAINFHYKDQFNNIQATVIGKPIFEIHDSYYAVITKNRPKNWFIKLQWSRWEFKGQITNRNKLVKVDSLQTFVIR